MSSRKSFGIVVLIIILVFELAYLGDNPELLFPPGPTPAATAAPTPEPTPSPTPEPTPYVPVYGEEDMWMLAIASADYPMESEYVVETTAVEGYLFDARAAGALQAMLDAARADGMGVYITSAWRSRATQAGLYENRVYRFQLEGY